MLQQKPEKPRKKNMKNLENCSIEETFLAMSCPATNMTGFNKSKEDFIWFIKKASTDIKSDAHAEQYHGLLKMFIDADTNKDDLVSKASFNKLVDMAASIPRMYGYAPKDSELFLNEHGKEFARKKMFDSMDLKSTVVITFDEWYKFSMDHIRSKTATLHAHPILDHGNSNQFMTFLNAAVRVGTPENTELYWFFLQLFTDADANKDGIVTFMMDNVLVTPKKLGLEHPDAGMMES